MYLWKNCEGLLGNIERRRSTSTRGKNDAEISDILQGMRKLDNVENRPTFVAVDWKRLLKNVPDELDIFSIVERINDLEILAKKQDGRITKSAEDVTKITMERPNVMIDGDVSDEPNRCMPTSEDETCVKSALWSNEPNRYANALRRKPAERNVAQLNVQMATVSREVEPPAEKPRAKEQRDIEENGDAPFERTREDLRREERRKRRQEIHRQAVYGTGSSSSGRFRGRPRTKELFVFRVERDTDCDEIREYIENRNMHVVSIKCMSKPEYRSQSFCIEIRHEEFETLSNASFWPEGVGCREFRKSRYQNNNGEGNKET